MFLNSVTSELLMPGPRTTSFGELPGFPRGGRANAAGLNQPVRPGSESVGSPTSSGTPQPAAGADAALGRPAGPPANRLTSPPPVMSALSTVVKHTLTGVPLAKVVMPDSCQLSSSARAIAVFQRALAFGRSHV